MNKANFWNYVDRSGGDNACWLWSGALNAAGYGILRFGERRNCLAHRIAYELATNIKPVLGVLHRCDVPRCCNPAHLFLGSHIDNVRDRHAKGRTARGVDCRHAKVTPEEVIAIRRLADAGETYASIGRQFRITYQTASKIHKRRLWSHID